MVSETVRQLRRRWKPVKERLQDQQTDHSTNIRFHRSCSWLQQVESQESGEDFDLKLTYQWIAFNALYGQWDEQARDPKPDRQCWRTFLDRVLAIDTDGQVEEVLIEHKKLVMALLDDEYLSSYFWQDPGDKRARQSKKAFYDARTWYLEKRWPLVLDRMIERIYLLRCQLLHGAATYGSSLNRTSLRRCTTMMGHLLTAVLQVWIDRGSNEDWGPMCYPPIGTPR